MTHQNVPGEKWKQRRRGGLIMSQRMLLLLQDMRAAQAAGWKWVAFNGGVHKRTINSLIRRDWISQSKGIDGVRYSITARGLKALRVFEAPTYRYDGICPTCGLRPRAVTASGNELAYCRECQRLHRKRQYELFGHQFAPDSLCPDCGQRPRQVYPSGKRGVYCRECRNKRRREERRSQKNLNRKRIERGEVLLCCRCHSRPRAYTDKTIYDYCEECRREYHREYYRSRHPHVRKASRPTLTNERTDQ